VFYDSAQFFTKTAKIQVMVTITLFSFMKAKISGGGNHESLCQYT